MPWPWKCYLLSLQPARPATCLGKRHLTAAALSIPSREAPVLHTDVNTAQHPMRPEESEAALLGLALA